MKSIWIILLLILSFSFIRGSFQNSLINKEDTLRLLEYYNNKCDSLIKKREYHKAMEPTIQMLAISEAMDSYYYMAKTYYYIGDLYNYSSNDVSIAENFYSKSLFYAQSPGDTSLQINIYMSLSDLYGNTNQIQKTGKTLNKSLGLAIKYNDTEKILLAHLKLAEYYRHIVNRYDSALFHYNKSSLIAEQNHHAYYLSYSTIEIGCLNQQFNLLDKVVPYYNKGLEIALKNNLSDNNVNYHFGKYYYKTHDFQNSKLYLSKAVEKYHEWDFMKKEIYSLLADIAEKQNNFKEALYYTKLYNTSSDSIAVKNQLNNTLRIEVKYELEKMEAQNEKRLQESNLKTQLAQKKQRNIFTAFLLSSVILLLIIYILFWQYRRKKLESKMLESKNKSIRQLSEELHKRDQAKLNFYTNISHEFRTPLTLISSPVEQLLNKKYNNETKRLLQFIATNSKKLKSLIDQLLDLSKLDVEQIEMNTDTCNINELVKNCYAVFQSLSREKNIEFRLKLPDEKLYAEIDRERIEQVIYNLLSNACKFCKIDGYISIELTQSDNEVIISVRDNGIGIPEDEIHNIFNRFYQVNSKSKFTGSGIGLAYAKEIIELHAGSINVSSRLNEYTEFTIKLNRSLNNHTLDKEKQIVEKNNIPDKNPPDLKKLTQAKNTILVVDDDNELLNYLSTFFNQEYQVIKATNGVDGYKQAEKINPEIIISDIIMPAMNGFELTEKIKSNINTSHIPVILLTAKAETENKYTGLTIGADDYLNKPFDVKELELKVRNLIASRNILREKYKKLIEVIPSEVDEYSMDEKFLIKVTNIIEKNISDSDLSIEFICDIIGMTRQHLHRKIKALTELSPNQFIRLIRLKRAAQLIKQESGSISEIAYQCGFDNLSYFTKRFKETFHTTPSEYK